MPLLHITSFFSLMGWTLDDGLKNILCIQDVADIVEPHHSLLWAVPPTPHSLGCLLSLLASCIHEMHRMKPPELNGVTFPTYFHLMNTEENRCMPMHGEYLQRASRETSGGIWLSHKETRTYVEVKLGKTRTKPVIVSVHRLLCWIFSGPPIDEVVPITPHDTTSSTPSPSTPVIPPAFTPCVMHTCKESTCCNYKHVLHGDYSANQIDSWVERMSEAKTLKARARKPKGRTRGGSVRKKLHY